MKSDVELNQMGVLQRREIEARILAPVLDALGQAFGKEAVMDITRRTIAEIARGQGRELAEQLGASDLAAFARGIEPWSRNSSLELRILDQDESRLSFDVTRCRYAELYREFGMVELGAILSCNRDAAFVEGFNSAVRLNRTQTILGGATHCDFRFSKDAGPQ